MTFTQFGLEPALLARLAARGYRQATALQLAALPVMLQGLPLLACGRPGSGHSEAFLLAALQRNAAQPVAGLQTVVVAASVHRAQMYARQMLALGGDALRAAILEEDGAGADAALLIVVPAQLQQLAQLLPAAPPLRMLVVDGLDALLRTDAAPALRTLLSQLPAGVQTALFCDEAADAVLVLARTLHADAALLPVASDGPGSIPQRAWPVPRPLKMRLLMRMLKELDAARLLLIAPGGHMGIQFARKLRTRNVRASYLAADTSAAAAGEMLRSFQNGRLPVLIVPDQLPGELDASTITHLVNFDLPRQPAYLARLQAVPAAVVCSLVTPMEEQSLLDLEDKLGHPLWRDLVSDFDYTSETPAEAARAGGSRVAGTVAEWDPEIPRTWGERGAPRVDPPKMPLEDWQPEPLPAIWSEPPKPRRPAVAVAAPAKDKKAPSRGRSRARRQRSSKTK